jgi:hypothetical protein
MVVPVDPPAVVEGRVGVGPASTEPPPDAPHPAVVATINASPSPNPLRRVLM